MSELIYDILSKPDIATPHIIGRGILPVKGKLILAGTPKANKSWIALNLAIALARGSPPFLASYKTDQQVFPVYTANKVLYVEMEMGEQGVRDRFKCGLLTPEQALGLPLHLSTRDVRFRMDTPEGRKLIEDEVMAVLPSVCVFDPLAKFHGADENDAREMGNILRFGDYLCDKYSTAIIWLHHTTKPPFDPKYARTGGDRLRGSSAMYADADTVCLVDRISAEDASEPVIALSFELRRGEPLRRQFVQRLRSGHIKYIGEGSEGQKEVNAIKQQS